MGEHATSMQLAAALKQAMVRRHCDESERREREKRAEREHVAELVSGVMPCRRLRKPAGFGHQHRPTAGPLPGFLEAERADGSGLGQWSALITANSGRTVPLRAAW